MIQQFGNDEKLVVMIKPLPGSSFQNAVNMQDEMKICAIKRYALMDLSPEEKDWLANK